MTNTTINQSAQAVLRHFELEHYAFPFLIDPDGLALLALLCNAGAKGYCGRPANTTLYAHKATLVAAACQAADQLRW